MWGSIMEENKIVAKDGYILTNGSAFGKIVFLGVHDLEENWYEITIDEYNEIINAELEEANEDDYIEALQTMGVEI